jgi:subtilisin inhibitor-like
MRALVVALTLVTIGLASTSISTAATGTTLRVTYWEDSTKPADSVTWTLRCGPAGGTLARPGRACTQLRSGGARLFAPLPKNVVCTEIYGGPQRARVVGTVDGKRVWATFTRANGCEISRWQRIAPWLVPQGGVT